MCAIAHRLLQVESGFLRHRPLLDLGLARDRPAPRDLSSPRGDLVQEEQYRDAIRRLSDRPNLRD